RRAARHLEKRVQGAPLVDLERAEQRQAEKFLVEHPRLFGVAAAIRVVVQALNLGHVSLQYLVVQKKILTFLADNTFWSSTRPYGGNAQGLLIGIGNRHPFRRLGNY